MNKDADFIEPPEPLTSLPGLSGAFPRNDSTALDSWRPPRVLALRTQLTGINLVFP
jgi:hypothetical protein